MRVTLVCGLPGTGKSTYVKEHLGAGALAYDLDAIAAAFRLRMPHEEQHDAAQQMANAMLFGFIDNARWYTNELFVIRTAPNLPELSRIHPDEVVICETQYIDRDVDVGLGAESKLWTVQRYCERNNVPYTVI